ncbi:MAG: hypothetical protein AABX79_01940 [Nanoarchaeota archaeon]
MKVKITCTKCGSENVKIVSEDGIPTYRCGKCGHKNRIFPKFESDKN